MTDQGSNELEPGDDTAISRAPKGRREAGSSKAADYREGLRSRRWDAAPLENPEVEKTDPRVAVGALVAMGVITLTVLLIGYGVGLWNLPA